MRTLQENINQVNSDFNAIKAKIIESGVEVADGTKTEEYAAKVGKVYEAGKKAEYDAFWDAYQINGTRTAYSQGFSGAGWGKDIFYPKYDIKPAMSYMMFREFGRGNPTENKNFDLVQRLEELGVEIDFSNSKALSYMFYDAAVKRIPPIAALNSSLTNTFEYCACKTIDKLILKDDGSNTFTNTFNACYSLENIIIEGVIGENGFDVKSCTKLTKASIESIINALSITTIGLTVTLSKTAKEAAFTEDEWNTLIATKTNWTISLV